MTQVKSQSWILENSIPEPNSGCWIWMNYVNADGYGRANNNGAVRGAHRISYEIMCGEIPKDAVVMHKCDVRCCINPSHLRLGTQTDNIRDATLKGRMKTPSKGKWWAGKTRSEEQKIKLALRRSTLTLDQVKRIKSDLRPNREIALEYGVKKSAIYRIKSGKSFVLPLKMEG